MVPSALWKALRAQAARARELHADPHLVVHPITFPAVHPALSNGDLGYHVDGRVPVGQIIVAGEPTWH